VTPQDRGFLDGPRRVRRLGPRALPSGVSDALRAGTGTRGRLRRRAIPCAVPAGEVHPSWHWGMGSLLHVLQAQAGLAVWAQRYCGPLDTRPRAVQAVHLFTSLPRFTSPCQGRSGCAVASDRTADPAGPASTAHVDRAKTIRPAGQSFSLRRQQPPIALGRRYRRPLAAASCDALEDLGGDRSRPDRRCSPWDAE
jgi:hypothetical protein